MEFFTLLICVTLSQFYSFSSLVLFTKTKKLWNERKENFLYMAASLYHAIPNEMENCAFTHNPIFRHTYIYKQHIRSKKWGFLGKSNKKFKKYFYSKKSLNS